MKLCNSVYIVLEPQNMLELNYNVPRNAEIVNKAKPNSTRDLELSWR